MMHKQKISWKAFAPYEVIFSKMIKKILEGFSPPLIF